MTAATLEAIDREYQDHMARRPRATRSLERIDDLVRRTEALVGDGEVGQRAGEMLERYRNERRLIAELQNGGDYTRRAHRANAIGNMIQARYTRHFANKERGTRDLELLRELGARLDWAVKEMEAVAGSWDHEVFASARKRHQELAATIAQEITMIPQEISRQQTGDQARGQAVRANHQFRWYRLCFAGKSRNSRRLALLDRMIAGLTAVRNGMDQLAQQGLNDQVHDDNRRLVANNLATWQREQASIRQAQGAQTGNDLNRLLANDANALFTRYREMYAGKDRSSLDPQPLEDLCDELGEIALHMDESDRVWGNFEANLFTVLENLMIFEDEVNRINLAKPRP